MTDKLYTEVLKLNKNWQPIGTLSTKQALSDMSAGAVTGLYVKNGEMTPLRWRDWLNLTLEDDDEYIQSARMKVKIPRVVITVKFDKLIVKAPKISMKALRERDNDTCIYTGKKLKPSQMSVEHVTPVSKGGQTSWDNIALCDRDVNSERGNMSHEKFGKKPLWTPTAPIPVQPQDKIINRCEYPEWDLFLNKKKKK